MKPYLLFFIIISLVASCSKDENGENGNGTDPWSELRDLEPGEVKFDGDYFCYYDCLNDVILCGQRIIRNCRAVARDAGAYAKMCAEDAFKRNS